MRWLNINPHFVWQVEIRELLDVMVVQFDVLKVNLRVVFGLEKKLDFPMRDSYADDNADEDGGLSYMV